MKSRHLLLLQLSLLLLHIILAADGNADASASSSSSAITTSDTSQAVCTVKGRVFTRRQWYGYLFHKAFHQNYAKIVYQITYPVKECCSNLLIYYDDQVKQLKPSMTCDERTSVLPQNNNQIIPLITSNDTNGCTFWNETGEAFYVCRGERIFRSSIQRTWFFALSHCGQEGPLNLNYVFNITGYHGECEEDPLSTASVWDAYVRHSLSDQTSSSSKEVYTYLSISLGILAGIALILAAVFFALWFLGLRKAAKGKGSSVTSSQATMTQDDIFYVNPSLSDREQAEYSQSGSENYYEVIPERRSYESINAGGLPNGAAAHIRQMRAFHGALGHHPMGGGPAGPHAHAHPHPHAHGAHPHPHAQHALAHPHAQHPHSLAHPHALAHHPGHYPGGPTAAHHQAHPSAGQHPASHPNHPGHPGHPHLQTKEAGGMRGVTYTFEDYPPPPYQPPKLLGIGKQNVAASSSGGTPGHTHTISLPAGQGHQRQQLQQRPQFGHHAYHSSIVPTSAALGGGGGIVDPNNLNLINSSTPISLGGPGISSSNSSNGIGSINTTSNSSAGVGQSPGGGMNMSLNLMNPLSPISAGNSVGHMTSNPSATMSQAGPNMAGGGQGQGQSLGTFGQPHSASNNNNNNLSGLNPSHLMPTSSSGGPPPTLASVLSSATSSASQSALGLGQSETSA